MNFKRLLGDATRLTRRGDPVAATRAIREALGGTAGRAPERDRQAASGAAPAERDASVIDGEWRTLGEEGEAFGGRRGGVSRVRHAGRSRTLDYRLFVPPLGPDASPPPLVVMLHGCTQDADDFAVGTAMDALALEHGLIVLYPEQSGRANPQRCWNWFKDTHQRRGQGEPALIAGAIGDVVATHGADPERVFVAGLSAGGAMAAVLGDTYPDLVRAVGVHSGLAAGVARDLPGALAAMRGAGVAVASGTGDIAERCPPTIVFHGDADSTVHPRNGEQVIASCLARSRRPSANAREPERHEGRRGGRGWTREVYRDTHGAPLAERWHVHGAGHAWSGGDARGTYADAVGPDASAEMVRFFLETSA